MPRATSSPEPNLTDTFYFSHPQCHLVQKHNRPELPHRPLYTIPDFAFTCTSITHTPNGGELRKESVAFLTEIKRLHDEGKHGCSTKDTIQLPTPPTFCLVAQPLPFINSKRTDLAFIASFQANTRQLLLQAFCGWHVYDQPQINLLFICGISFALIKFTRPPSLNPLPTLPASTGEKRKHGDIANTISAMSDILEPQISQWVPRSSVKVIYWAEATTKDPRSQELHLSAAFRGSLKHCVSGTDSQPSSLFDVTEAEVRSEL